MQVGDTETSHECETCRKVAFVCVCPVYATVNVRNSPSAPPPKSTGTDPSISALDRSFSYPSIITADKRENDVLV